ncbi:MAG: phospho-sugar mutase, partial [Clostridia bacterium]|nr:phospho-sugar mutase [Clostridia bacterium]
MEAYRQRYEAWLASPLVDEASKAELTAIRDDEDELKMRFGSTMEFGTGGLRAKMSAGTNRM